MQHNQTLKRMGIDFMVLFGGNYQPTESNNRTPTFERMGRDFNNIFSPYRPRVKIEYTPTTKLEVFGKLFSEIFSDDSYRWN